MASFDRPPSTTSIQSPRRQSIAYQLNNIMNMWHFLPQGHEKHLKQAFYNTLANVFIIFTALAAVGVYYILAPFVQPLYWAVLCGTFLYPFKWRLTNILRGWLTGLQKSGTPFAVGLVVLPVQISNNFAYVMTQTIWNYKKALVALVLGLPMTYCLYHFAPANTIYNFSFGLLVSLNGFVDYFNSNWVIALFVGYMLCVVFLWTPETTWMSYVAAPVWVALFLMIANVAGPLRVPLFLLLVVVIIVGIIKEVLPEEDGNEASQQEANSASQGSEKEVLPAEETTATVESGPTIEKPSAETDDSSSLSEQTSESPAAVGLAKQGQSKSATASVGRQPDNQEAASIEPKADFSKPKHQTQPGESKSSPSVLDKPGSLPLTKGSHRTHHRESSAAVALNQLKTSQVNSYFTLLFLGHFIVRIWMHLWIVALLLLIPLLHYCARLLVRQFQKDGIFYDQAESAKASCSRWMEARKSALMPQCLRGAGAFLMKGDQQMISVLEKGLDQATSILFILMLLVGTLLFSIIGAVQIQRETVYMASVTQKIFNETMNSNEFSEWMPKADEIKVNMDRFLKNSHQQGRNLIASRVIDFMPKDSTQEEKDNLVNQILEIWDKLYDTVLASLAEEPKTPKKSSVTGAEGDADPSNLYDSLGSTMNNVSGMLHMSAAVEFVKQNLGMFMSVLESVFTVMKSNMTLILTVVTFVFSAILGGGTAILNFVISSTISLARHTASGTQINVGSLWWQKVKISAPVSESATVHQDRSVTVQFEC
ncbi:transmembrane protein 245-like [Plakobranchus ocellatus]|uniref:Transmembrane protein 245-like n=1 Tax=Plakobranchus ocellatus TaxID=259542 RepID=A0AAV4D6I7_9GAST|nr:transmembrane protein 245-like [Plakobranchus ocellatus]